MENKHNHTRITVEGVFMTAKEIEQDMRKPDFRAVNREYGGRANEKIVTSVYNDAGQMVEEFHKMMHEQRQIPRQWRYCRLTNEMVREALIRAGIDPIKPIMDEGNCRNTRTHMGAVVETHAKARLLDLIPNIRIVEGDRLDLDAGVDLYIHDLVTDLVHCIHVTSEGAGEDFLDEKSRRTKYPRNFDDHNLLLYTSKYNLTSKSTKYVKIFPLLRDEYLLEQWGKWKTDGKAKPYYESDLYKMASLFEQEGKPQEIRITYARDAFEQRKEQLIANVNAKSCS